MHIAESPPGAYTQIDGRRYLYFAGTGYLGLQSHPEVIRAASEAAQTYGLGSANSRTAFGTTQPVLDVERAAAAFFGQDDAFYFASGWMGNNVLLQMLDDDVRLVLVDECSHYSLFEAARLSTPSPITFRHRDANDLHEKLKKHLQPGQYPLVLTDGVFAATGRIAPADQYCVILQEYPGATLLLDDAHGLAILGPNGRGTYEHLGLWPTVSPRQGTDLQGWSAGEGPGVRAVISDQWSAVSDQRSQISKSPIPNPEISTPPLPCPALLLSGTLSKAVGGFGGIIPGNRDFIDRIKSRSPYFAGASALPAPIATATAKALEIVMADPSLREKLRTNVQTLKAGLRRLGFDVDDTPVPIVSLTIGTSENMQRIQRELFTQGIALPYMSSYAGLKPQGALRIAIFATHTEEMIERLMEELHKLV